jgi:serine/threonine protein kinase
MLVVGEITYRRIRQIGTGEGQNSTVWLAEDPQRGGIIAVKEIDKPKLLVPIDELFREARVMFSATHQNVVRVECAFQTTDQVCLGMKYYQDGSLLEPIS